MGLEGRLEGTGLLDFFQLIDRSRTGALRVFVDGRTYTVFVRSGAVAAALVAPPRKGDRTLERLVRAGRLPEQFVPHALTLQQRVGRILIGQLIVEHKWATASDVVAALQCQLRETVLSLFLLREGRLRFDECPVELPILTPDPLGLRSLLLEGLDLQNEWPRILESEPSMTARLIPRRALSADPTGSLARDEQKVFQQIGNGTEYQRLLDESLTDTYSLRRSVVRLFQAGYLSADEEWNDVTWTRLDDPAGRSGSATSANHAPRAPSTPHLANGSPLNGAAGHTDRIRRIRSSSTRPGAESEGINLRRWRRRSGPLKPKVLVELSYRVARTAHEVSARRGLPAGLSAASFEQRTSGLTIIEPPPLDATSDAGADVFALGTVLYELACGQPPEPSVEGDVAPFHTITPDIEIPTTLEMVIQRCLLSDRARRYLDVRAVVSALEVLRAAEDVC